MNCQWVRRKKYRLTTNINHSSRLSQFSIIDWLLVFHSQDVLSKRTKRFNSFFPLLHQTGIRKYNFWLSDFINITFYIDQRICSNNLIILPLKLFSYNSLNKTVLFPTREIIKVWQFLMFSQFFYFATLILPNITWFLVIKIAFNKCLKVDSRQLGN